MENNKVIIIMPSGHIIHCTERTKHVYLMIKGAKELMLPPIYEGSVITMDIPSYTY